MKYRKLPIVIEAVQWFRIGDHPAVKRDASFSHQGGCICKECGTAIDDHAVIDTLEGVHIVCPGDFIITGIKGEFYPCKPDIFARTYESADDTPTPPVTQGLVELCTIIRNLINCNCRSDPKSNAPEAVKCPRRFKCAIFHSAEAALSGKEVK